MMGRLEQEQGQLFYSFRLEEVVPDDHQVRAIASVLDLSWVYGELSPLYPALGRPSIDPVLMIRMLILGYAFGLRSERLLCREVRVKLVYRRTTLVQFGPPPLSRKCWISSNSCIRFFSSIRRCVPSPTSTSRLPGPLGSCRKSSCAPSIGVA